MIDTCDKKHVRAQDCLLSDRMRGSDGKLDLAAYSRAHPTKGENFHAELNEAAHASNTDCSDVRKGGNGKRKRYANSVGDNSLGL